MKNFLKLILASLVLFSLGCEKIGTAEFGEALEEAQEDTQTEEDSSQFTGSEDSADIGFAGLDSIGSPTHEALTLNWTSNSEAIAYEIYETSSSPYKYIATVSAPASGHTLNGLEASTKYTYRVFVKDQYGKMYTNDNDVAAATAPADPSSVSRIHPSSDDGVETSPVIRVSGTVSGDAVKVYTDASCSQLAGSTTAASTSVDVSVDSLSAGSYTFYAQTENSYGVKTNCVPASGNSYTLHACPGGYIPVPENTNVGADGFCVMRYEAKNDGSSNAVTGEAGVPWTGISQSDAHTECSDINSREGVSHKYHLISNSEWMAIARNAESVAENWTGGTVGSGCLKRGNVGASVSCSSVQSGYNNGGLDSGASRSNASLAQLKLSNGETIWDFAGNAAEWVNWKVHALLKTVSPSAKAYDSSDGNPVSSWIDFLNLDTNIGSSDAMKAATWQAGDNSLDQTKGVGSYYAGDNSSGGAAIRGGGISDGQDAGVYALKLDAASGDTSADTGFRCVYRPLGTEPPQTVIAAAQNPTNPELIIDGDMSTIGSLIDDRNSTAPVDKITPYKSITCGYCIELGVDFGSARTLSSVELYSDGAFTTTSPTSNTNFEVFSSQDGSTWSREGSTSIDMTSSSATVNVSSSTSARYWGFVANPSGSTAAPSIDLKEVIFNP